MEQELPSKKDVCIALLEQSVVRVFLDPRREGVTIPVWLKKQPQLLLDVGLNMPIPIPDLHVGEDALTCTLSFNRAPFFCVVPWTSVFALVGDGDRGMIWPDDVPSELQIHAAQSPAKPARPRPQLTAVQNPPSEAPPAEEATSAEAQKGKSERPEKQPKLERVARGEKADNKKRNGLQAAPSEAPPAADKAGEAKGSKSRKPPAERRPKEAIKPAPLPTVAAASGTPKTDGLGKKKRELPPYLRVIK
ncbi:MAG: hypothetical protein U0174_03630 [Polyangiaceae bacterium]